MKKLLCFFLLIPGIVSADTLNVGNPISGDFVTIAGIGQVFAGSFTGTFTGSPQDYNNIQIYCVDTKDDIGIPTTFSATASSLSGSSVFQGAAIANAASNIAAIMAVTWGGIGGGVGFDSTNSDWNAALQVALWNGEYNGMTPVVNSYITALPSPVQTDANLIIAAANANYANAVSSGFTNTILFTADYHSPTQVPTPGQDMVTWNPSGGGNQNPPVPEPSSLALMGLGGLVIGVYRRRRVSAV